MKALFLAAAAVLAAAPLVAVDYPITEDSKPHEGVPKGEKLSLVFNASKIFPGTTRNVTVYVPRQYDPAKPACVWVNQDGMQHKADVVFDNLIAKGEMPVTIYIAASPGVVKALDGKTALDRFNRSYEYDGLGDNYARFVLEELLPFVEQQKTSDGRRIVLSKKGNDRCIGGSSSGAVCAFTAAWERPNEFRRVFSTIGTYVSLRGADRYPSLIRKYEPKPIRVFLQDGDHDQNIYGGDWWMANQMMERALTFAGYEVNHAWGQEGHNAKQGDQIFPDAVRWIWKDWPKEPQNGKTGNAFLNDILIPGEGWQVAHDTLASAHGLAVDPAGTVVFRSGDATEPWQITPDGKESHINGSNIRGHASAFGPDGRYYTTAHEQSEILTYNAAGKESVVLHDFPVSNFVVLPDGSMYAVPPRSSALFSPGTIWHVSANGEKRVVDDGAKEHIHLEKPLTSSAGPVGDGNIRELVVPQSGLHAPWGLALSPDHSLLYISDTAGQFVYSYQIQPDGSLKNRQPYFHLHLPDDEYGSQARGMCVDAAGRLYVATKLGVQVCDQAGRVNCILPTPNGMASEVTFGGPNFDTLYVAAGDKVYRRKLKVKGVPAFAAPVKPAAPRL